METRTNTRTPICMHACRTTCALLNTIMREETEMMKLYEVALTECESTDMKMFVHEMMVAKSRSILSVLQKLNELRARGEIGDNVMSSFQ